MSGIVTDFPVTGAPVRRRISESAFFRSFDAATVACRKSAKPSYGLAALRTGV